MSEKTNKQETGDKDAEKAAAKKKASELTARLEKRAKASKAKILAVVGGPSRELRHVHRLEDLDGITTAASVEELTQEDLDELIPQFVPVKTFESRELAEKYADQLNQALLTRRAQILGKDAKVRRERERYLAEHPNRRLALRQKQELAERDARIRRHEAQARRQKALAERAERAKLQEELSEL